MIDIKSLNDLYTLMIINNLINLIFVAVMLKGKIVLERRRRENEDTHES